tara:strand:+ start:92 stop:370 length:279 start_codon:yes stop_codon:yes gene_type:complete
MMVWKYRPEQSEEYVADYLKDKELSFTFDERLPAFYINHPDPEKHYIAYQYYYTTGRWGVMYNKRNQNRKHYRCKNIETLVDKYILNEDKGK